jgi:hypothetical protein
MAGISAPEHGWMGGDGFDLVDRLKKNAKVLTIDRIRATRPQASGISLLEGVIQESREYLV